MRNTDTLGNATAQEAYESMGRGVAIERNTGTLLSKIRETRNKIRETQGPWLGVGVFSSLWDDRNVSHIMYRKLCIAKNVSQIMYRI